MKRTRSSLRFNHWNINSLTPEQSSHARTVGSEQILRRPAALPLSKLCSTGRVDHRRNILRPICRFYRLYHQLRLSPSQRNRIRAVCATIFNFPVSEIDEPRIMVSPSTFAAPAARHANSKHRAYNYITLTHHVLPDVSRNQNHAITSLMLELLFAFLVLLCHPRY